MSIPHTVEQGECLLSIAAKFGFVRWQTIYDHPDNAELKRKRPDPNVLFPGDCVRIPDKELKQAARPTTADHRFTLKTSAAVVRIVLHDAEGEPLKGKRYRLEIGGAVHEASVPANGLVEHPAPVSERKAALHVWMGDGEAPDLSWDLALGGLDPHDTVSGVQARLNNLGFPCAVDGILGPRTAAALRAFQRARKLPLSGKMDDATCAKLRAAHDDLDA